MILLAVRHGNTFEKQIPVWIGAQQDLPLVLEGQNQSQKIAALLKHYPIDNIFCASLKRTQQTAEIIAQASNLNYRVDERLNELDYQNWANKTLEELEELYGKDALSLWREQGIYPQSAAWSWDYKRKKNQISSLLKDLKKSVAQCIVIVTSQGVLKIVASFFENDYQKLQLEKKVFMHTGHFSVMNLLENKIIAWNICSKISEI